MNNIESVLSSHAPQALAWVDRRGGGHVLWRFLVLGLLIAAAVVEIEVVLAMASIGVVPL